MSTRRHKAPTDSPEPCIKHHRSPEPPRTSVVVFFFTKHLLGPIARRGNLQYASAIDFMDQ